MKPALLILAGLAAITAGILTAPHLADLLPAAVLALCMVVLGLVAAVALVVTP